MNQSVSNFNVLIDVLSKFANKVRQGTKSEEPGKKDEKQTDGQNHESDKHGKEKWTDTMQDLFNKTKASVYDVSKQIQDTWKQVNKYILFSSTRCPI